MGAATVGVQAFAEKRYFSELVVLVEFAALVAAQSGFGAEIQAEAQKACSLLVEAALLVPVAVAEAEQTEAQAFLFGCSAVLSALEKAATTALLVLELAVAEEKLVEAAEERAEAAP